MPPGAFQRRDGRLPLIVYCHGGPVGGVTYGLFPQFAHTVGQVDPYPAEAMASAGYAVLFPMPRGGSGYGEAGHRAIINAWGEGDYKDIMAGVDHLIAQGIADPERLGVMGASYGGFMTNWIVTQTNRFKAAASAASISDLNDLYYLPDGGDLMIEYFRRPWENRESYTAHSPLTFAREGDDADSHPAWRSRPARADQQRAEVLSRAQGDGQGGRVPISIRRRSRLLRAAAAAGVDAPRRWSGSSAGFRRRADGGQSLSRGDSPCDRGQSPSQDLESLAAADVGISDAGSEVDLISQVGEPPLPQFLQGARENDLT